MWVLKLKLGCSENTASTNCSASHPFSSLLAHFEKLCLFCEGRREEGNGPSWYACGGQQTTLRSQFLPSGTQVVRLDGKRLYPLIRLTDLQS